MTKHKGIYSRREKYLKIRKEIEYAKGEGKGEGRLMTITRQLGLEGALRRHHERSWRKGERGTSEGGGRQGNGQRDKMGKESAK